VHQPHSVEKDDPQPQVDLAFGFLNVNPPPVIVSTKPTSAFFRYWILIGVPDDHVEIRREGENLA
jgi:hypothetical protein